MIAFGYFFLGLFLPYITTIIVCCLKNKNKSDISAPQIAGQESVIPEISEAKNSPKDSRIPLNNQKVVTDGHWPDYMINSERAVKFAPDIEVKSEAQAAVKAEDLPGYSTSLRGAVKDGRKIDYTWYDHGVLKVKYMPDDAIRENTVSTVNQNAADGYEAEEAMEDESGVYRCYACGRVIEEPGELCPFCRFPVISTMHGHKDELEQIRQFAEEYRRNNPEFFK